MITPEYIKGYLAALRTIQKGSEAMISSYEEEETSSEYEFQHAQSAISTLKNIIVFIKDQRSYYKELVDKLNKENANG